MDKAAADPQKVFINSSLVKFLFLINYALGFRELACSFPLIVSFHILIA